MKYLLILIAIGGIFFPLEGSYATQESSEGFIGYPVFTGNRDYVFEDSVVDFCTFSQHDDKYNEIASKAVLEWQDNLKEITGNHKVWNMTVHKEPYDVSVCDGFINYYKIPEEAKHQIYGYIGYSDPHSKFATISIYTDYYQKTLKAISENANGEIGLIQFQDIVKNSDHESFSDDEIFRTTLHELGHVLGLNHPIGDLTKAPGIMSYNPNETAIIAEEIKQVVKTYPNGFSKQKKAILSDLDNHDSTNKFFVGERSNMVIELPYQKGDSKIDSFSLFFYPHNDKKFKDGQINFVKKLGKSAIDNTSKYFEYFKAVPVSFSDEQFVISIHFVPNKVIDDMDVRIVTEDQRGFSKEVSLEKIISVENALFSEILLEDENYEWGWNLSVNN